MWVYNNSIRLDIFSYKLDSVFVSWILRKYQRSLTVATNIPITTSGTVPKILIIKYHNNIHTLCFLANNSERSLHTSECYKLQRGRVKKREAGPFLSFCEDNLQSRVTVRTRPLHWANQSEGSGESIEFRSYCTRNLLILCVCVFGISRPQRIREAHILSSIDFQL